MVEKLGEICLVTGMNTNDPVFQSRAGEEAGGGQQVGRLIPLPKRESFSFEKVETLKG